MSRNRLAACIGISLLLGLILGAFLPQTLQSTAPVERQHYPLYPEIYQIKDRLLINITDQAFPSTGVRECIWYELREEDSGDYNQTTVNFWVFQNGQETHGDIEAFVEIYNVPDYSDRFIIEITRNCWFELTASYEGQPFVVFPSVTGNELSYGYMTYEVTL
jgi:hypothetical protein